jgi:hypothetical protein
MFTVPDVGVLLQRVANALGAGEDEETDDDPAARGSGVITEAAQEIGSLDEKVL